MPLCFVAAALCYIDFLQVKVIKVLNSTVPVITA